MKDQKFTYRELKEMQTWSLEDKILRAEQLILSELKTHHTPSLACSWGKASVVMLHLVRKFCKRVACVFHNTFVQYPQTYEYRDLILQKWELETYVETKPIKGFWDCVKTYGYPSFRRMGRGKKGEKDMGKRTPKCCYYLKEKPAMDFLKQNKIDLEFVGLQASESMVRRLSFFREGEAFDSKKYGCRVVRPLMIWLDEDLWEYHDRFAIPKNPIYELMKRNGCMPCTGFKNWREIMAKVNPKMYAYISKEMGQPLLREYCGEIEYNI